MAAMHTQFNHQLSDMCHEMFGGDIYQWNISPTKYLCVTFGCVNEKLLPWMRNHCYCHKTMVKHSCVNDNVWRSLAQFDSGSITGLVPRGANQYKEHNRSNSDFVLMVQKPRPSLDFSWHKKSFPSTVSGITCRAITLPSVTVNP